MSITRTIVFQTINQILFQNRNNGLTEEELAKKLDEHDEFQGTSASGTVTKYIGKGWLVVENGKVISKK